MSQEKNERPDSASATSGAPVVPHPQCKIRGEHGQHGWTNGFGHHMCPGFSAPFSNWCPSCGRLKNFGCACDLPLAEKIRTLQVDRESLKQAYMPGRKGER